MVGKCCGTGLQKEIIVCSEKFGSIFLLLFLMLFYSGFVLVVIFFKGSLRMQEVRAGGSVAWFILRKLFGSHVLKSVLNVLD